MASRKPVAVYSTNDNGNGTKVFDIAHLNIPAILVVSLLSFVAWFTWSASTERAALEQRILSLEAAERAGGILSDEAKHDRWTTSDHTIWCLQAELVNPGWTCPGLGNLSKTTEPRAFKPDH